jgi:hypothetical protein
MNSFNFFLISTSSTSLSHVTSWTDFMCFYSLWITNRPLTLLWQTQFNFTSSPSYHSREGLSQDHDHLNRSKTPLNPSHEQSIQVPESRRKKKGWNLYSIGPAWPLPVGCSASLDNPECWMTNLKSTCWGTHVRTLEESSHHTVSPHGRLSSGGTSSFCPSTIPDNVLKSHCTILRRKRVLQQDGYLPHVVWS